MCRLLLIVAVVISGFAWTACFTWTARADTPQQLALRASTGDPAAQYQLAVAYANGDGMPADLSAAIRWFQAAAKAGHPDARQQLAFLREIGAIGDTVGMEAWRVQLATVANEDAARAEWRRLQRRYDLLANVALVAQPFATPEGGTVYRVQGGPFNEAQARDTCNRLRQQSVGCMLVRPVTTASP